MIEVSWARETPKLSRKFSVESRPLELVWLAIANTQPVSPAEVCIESSDMIGL